MTVEQGATSVQSDRLSAPRLEARRASVPFKNFTNELQKTSETGSVALSVAFLTISRRGWEPLAAALPLQAFALGPPLERRLASGDAAIDEGPN
jgi:hypothetical protein